MAGRNGRIYLEVTSGAVATPLPFLASWSINFATDKLEVTAMGDSNKVYVSGLPDASGDFAGFYDDATAQTYLAAIDGLPRKVYIYPSTLNTGQYWYGSILPDLSVNGAVDGPVAISASWAAYSAITKIG